MIPRLRLSSLLAVSGALAQQQLQLVALPAGTVYEPGQSIDFGAAPKTLTFDLNNTGPDDAVLTKLWVDGAAFTLGRNPAGLTLSVGQTLQFTIAFAPLTAGPARLGELWIQIAVSSVLQPQAEYDLVGSGAELAIAPRAATPTPTPAPMQQLQLAASLPPFTAYAPGGAPISFGTVQIASLPLIQTFSLTNNGPDEAVLTELSVNNAAFQVAWAGGDPVGLKIPVGQALPITISFAPSTAGQVAGQLAVQIATPASSPSPTTQPEADYSLTGTGAGATATPTPTPTPTPSPTPTPAWPTASIAIVPQTTVPDGIPQYTIAIRFDSALPASGAGLLTVDFTGKGDIYRGFILPDANGTFVPAPGSVSFTLTAGETAARFEGNPTILFQAGTTACTITFTAAIGDGTQLASPGSLPIPPVPVVVDLVLLEQAVSSTANGILVTVQGFDDTWTASTVSFTFYDTAGQMIGQPIPVDATAQFQTYFPSAATGSFGLTQSFNVTGDVADIGSVKVSITNSQGTSTPVVSQ